MLPTGFGYVEGVTYHHVCHGTRTVVAALDVANGKVISRVREHHRYQEFQDFLRQVGKQTPPDLDRRLIVHNHVPHKHGKGKARWARNSLFHFDFTPTFSSWLNQIERRFALVTERAIWRNSLTSVRELKQQFDLFMQRHNTDASPFQCVATADSILQRS